MRRIADDSEGSEDTPNPETDATDNGTPTDDKNAEEPSSVDADVKWITSDDMII